MKELSKVKRDLEVALKEVLQAMSANAGTPSNPNLEPLGHVRADARNCFSFSAFFIIFFFNPADVLVSDITDCRCYKQRVSV